MIFYSMVSPYEMDIGEISNSKQLFLIIPISTALGIVIKPQSDTIIVETDVSGYLL